MSKLRKSARKIRLTKISDDAFNGNHPNGIYQGHVVEGLFLQPPTIGERFYVICQNGFSTSPVIEPANSEGVFRTTYSTYKLEFLD
jgi:hypothetical protein